MMEAPPRASRPPAPASGRRFSRPVRGRAVAGAPAAAPAAATVGARAGGPSTVRPPEGAGRRDGVEAGSGARSLKHTGLVGRLRPWAPLSPTSRLCSQTRAPADPSGSVTLSVRLPVLGGDTVV